MTTTFGITRELDAALRNGFSQVGARIAAGTQMTTVVSALNALGISCEVEDGILSLKDGTREFNVSQALRSFANKPEHSGLFVNDHCDPKSWSLAQKRDFIAKHGLAAWEKKISTPVARTDVKPLDPNMPYEDYENLSRQERVAFIEAYGDDAVRRIYSRRRAKQPTTPAVKNRFASDRIEDYA
jgi:hypothetical protein